MRFTNSEFTMQKFTNADINKIIQLTGVSITMNVDFMETINKGNYFATLQSIENSASPYERELKNNDITL